MKRLKVLNLDSKNIIKWFMVEFNQTPVLHQWKNLDFAKCLCQAKKIFNMLNVLELLKIFTKY